MNDATSHPAGKSEAPRPGIAERLWDASRVEFSLRGYHGARVQGIARRAGCNVALLYRHWSSKKALYLEVLRTVWQALGRDVSSSIERGSGAQAVVGAYLDAHLRDPTGAQIMIREFLDGGPFLSQLVAADPTLTDALRLATCALTGPDAGGGALREGLDPTVAVLAVAGLAALVASAREASRPFFTEAPATDAWRRNVYDLLLHGVLPDRAPRADRANGE